MVFIKIQNKVEDRWTDFIAEIKENTDVYDNNHIKQDTFFSIVDKYKIGLTEEDKDILHQAFVSTAEPQNVKLNISHLYSVENSKHIKDLYQDVEFA